MTTAQVPEFRLTTGAANAKRQGHAALLTIILLIPLVLGAARAMAAEQVDLELVLAIDVSGSIDGFEAGLQRDGYVAALTDPLVLNAIRSGPHKRIAVTYFEWAGIGSAVATVPWTVIGSEEDAIAFTQALQDRPIVLGRLTSISRAMDFGMALFGQREFEAERQVIDISGDGPRLRSCATGRSDGSPRSCRGR